MNSYAEKVHKEDKTEAQMHQKVDPLQDPNLEQQIIKTIYDRFNLTDKLFPLTFSCEGEAEVTKTHTQHCEKCWWCQERFWAFGRYV
mgnify:CR=1 FL=1